MPSEFLINKYSKWYFNIIESARVQETAEYTEKHHIIPKSLGGSNTKDNLVKLTARQHFICHWLLTKMVITTKHQYQMWNAFSCMLYRARPGQQRHKISSHIFAIIKSEGSKIKSLTFSGENNPMYGMKGILNPNFGKKQSPEHIEKLRQSRIGKIRTDDAKRKQGDTTRGRKQSPEHIANRVAKQIATVKANKLAKLLATGVI
jgi:hypothetical protein